MKTFIIASAFLLALTGLQVKTFGQRIVVGARDEFAIGGGINLPLGQKTTDGTPTLLANMKPGYSIDMRYSTTVMKNLHLGGWVSGAKFSGWEASVNPGLYDGTKMTFRSYGPMLMYRPWSGRDILINRLSYCVIVSPGLSMINVETTSDSDINEGTNKELLTVKSTKFTMGLQAGLTYIVNTSFGANLIAGYRYTAAESKIFADKNYSFVSVSAGIFYRIHLDRRYKYSSL